MVLHEVNEGFRDYRIELTLDSNPIPGDSDFFWFFNDQPLVNGQNGAILGVDFIQFRSLSRVNTGSYRIVSSNTAGSGDFDFELKVNCKYYEVIFRYGINQFLFNYMQS